MQFMLYLFLLFTIVVLLFYSTQSFAARNYLWKYFLSPELYYVCCRSWFMYLKYVNEGARVVWSVEWPSYSLDDPGVKFWPGARDFSLHENIQTGSGGPWTFYLLVLVTSSLFVNQPWHEAGHWPFYYMNSTFFLVCTWDFLYWSVFDIFV